MPTIPRTQVTGSLDTSAPSIEHSPQQAASMGQTVSQAGLALKETADTAYKQMDDARNFIEESENDLKLSEFASNRFLIPR